MAEINANLFSSGSVVKQGKQRKVIIDKEAVGRTLKNIAAPVFDFFTKEAPAEEQKIADFEAEIKKYEMRAAITQRILNDSDPKSRTRMNVVI